MDTNNLSTTITTIAQYIIDNGIVPTSFGINDEVLLHACKHGNLEIVKLLTYDNKDELSTLYFLPLGNASKYGHLEIVKLLIEKGVDVNAGANYALKLACIYDHLDIIKILIKNGANETDDNLCLSWACNRGNFEMISLLLKNGAKLTNDILLKADPKIKLLFSNFKPTFYYGITSTEKLDIKLPELSEIYRDGNYHYVYKTLDNLTIKYKILTSLDKGEPREIFLI